MFSASKSKGASSGYQIANSLRFRSSASAYLNRTQSAGSQTTWTFSAWVKLGALSGLEYLLNAGGSSGSGIVYNVVTNEFQVEIGNGTTQYYARTSASFRDPSAWYHLVAVADTTNATSSNRLRLYVNGVQQTIGTSSYPTQNFTGYINQNSIAANIGRWNGATPTYYFDGYMAEINFIDGQALEPTAFGAINKETGVWAPIAYAGTYGLNGFHLDFKNGTSTTTLGYDTSGNGNNWTTNNISLTAGSTYDWMIDSPSKIQGTGYGVGNYAVLNPLDSASTTLISGNLAISQSTAWATGLSTIKMTSGKWYFEVICGVTALGSSACAAGIANQSYAVSGNLTGSNSCGYYSNDGTVYNNGSAVTVLGTYTNGDVIGVAFDIDSGKIWFAKNGTWLASGNPATGANPVVTGLSASSWSFGVASYSNTNNVTFGQRPFAYTPPSGYKSLCTYNLPTPTIQNGAGYMAATLYTGTSSSQSISNTVNGISFQPDFVWAKQRGAATDHVLYDSIRTGTYSLTSNNTAADVNQTSNGCTVAFASTGFTAGADSAGYLNYTGRSYVGWQWKAGGTAVSNTAGSITSSVSANTTSGFSVVTYTGTNNAGTIGHGLNATPSMIIVKARGDTQNWAVYHVSTGNTGGCVLNLTVANNTTNSGWWNNTSPTSSVFNVGGSTGSDWYTTNKPSIGYVAYCFAAIPGYSAFGSYTGNGSADGPFVYCGFRPRFILIKKTSIEGWFIWDSSRNTYNVASYTLSPNTSGVEGLSYLDLLSNGFKIRDTWDGVNGSGSTFIYAAFAENPFTNALAR